MSNRRAWILGGCASVLVLLAIIVGAGFLVVRHTVSVGERELTPLVERYLANVSRADYRSAYADFGQALRSRVSEQEYVRLDDGIHRRIGMLRSKTLEGVQTGIGPQGRWARMGYRCDFDSGPGTLRFEFSEENGAWKIVGFHYGSPAIDEALRSALTHDL